MQRETVIYVNDPRFLGKTDSETIQTAVDYAAENQIGIVIIPARNARTGEDLWVIDRAIVLPDHLTVELDGAHLRLADGVRDNIFRNGNCGLEIAGAVEGEQRELHLIGKNGAILDGGEPNGMSERLCREHPGEYPSMKVNLLVWFFNVQNFSVKGFRVINTRWWGLCFHFCREGVLSDIHFEVDASLRNRDGIDIRLGCENIAISEISGTTGDDVIALTALSDADLQGKIMQVKGKHADIRNISIRNIRAASCGCAIVRLLNGDGHAIQHITIDGVEDTGGVISAVAIRFGENHARYVDEKIRQMGEFSDIFVSNVTTTAQYALIFAEPTCRVRVQEIHAVGECAVLARFCSNFDSEDVSLSGLSIENDTAADCVFHTEEGADMAGCRIEKVGVGHAKYLYREREIPVSDWSFRSETPEPFSPEPPSLPSAYKRYLKN